MEKSTAVKRKYWREIKRKARARNKRYILAYLQKHPCVDCKEGDPVVLEFDHVRGNKIDTISNLAFKYTSSLKRITEEIKKCQVRCANCHRRRHAREFAKLKKKQIGSVTVAQ